jgi:hypothetical protein
VSHDEPTMNARNLHAARDELFHAEGAASSVATYCSRDCGSGPPARQAETVFRIAGQGYGGPVTYCSVVPRQCGRSLPVLESGGCNRMGGTENPGVLPLLSVRGAGSLALCPRVRAEPHCQRRQREDYSLSPFARPECFHRLAQPVPRPSQSTGRVSCRPTPPGLPVAGSRTASRTTPPWPER